VGSSKQINIREGKGIDTEEKLDEKEARDKHRESWYTNKRSFVERKSQRMKRKKESQEKKGQMRS